MTMLLRESDAYCAAKALIDLHGELAPAVAAKSIIEAAGAGNTERRIFRQMIGNAVSDLLRCRGAIRAARSPAA